LVNDQLNVKLNIQLNSHELSKLKKLAESSSNTETIDSIQDVTDILKNMIVEIKENKIVTNLQSISLLIKNIFADNFYLHYLVAGFVIVSGVIFLLFEKLKIFKQTKKKEYFNLFRTKNGRQNRMEKNFVILIVIVFCN
jgi:hypothetical protein